MKDLHVEDPWSRLKAELSVKGKKCNLQFNAGALQYFEEQAGFTDEEIMVLRMRSKGYSIQKIASKMSEGDKYYCKSTIEHRISSIKSKILNIL